MNERYSHPHYPNTAELHLPSYHWKLGGTGTVCDRL